jgi:phage/plasmid-associated DNA primase
VTKGVVKADKALTNNNEFNGELAGAIICAVEEKNIALTPGAHARIKDFVTAKTLSIREMRRNVYEVPNTTHWIQTANHQAACPVVKGDTRITVIEVGDLLPEQEVPEPLMRAKLKEEAPHFMYTLLNMPLPPSITRLRLPVVTTPSKAITEELNQTDLQKFIADCCQVKPGVQSLRFSEFYDAFQKSLDMGEKHTWTKIKVRRELPNRHRVVAGHGHERYIQNLVFKAPLEMEPC